MPALRISESRGRSSASGMVASRGRAHQARNIPLPLLEAERGDSLSTRPTTFASHLTAMRFHPCLCEGSISNSPGLRWYALTQKIHM
jgi:hypothetical protein